MSKEYRVLAVYPHPIQVCEPGPGEVVFGLDKLETLLELGWRVERVDYCDMPIRFDSNSILKVPIFILSRG